MHGTNSLLPADYAPPTHSPDHDTYTRGDKPDEPHLCTYDFSSCFFPKFKKSTKRGFSRRNNLFFFGFYGPKIGGGVLLPELCPKISKTLKFGFFQVFLPALGCTPVYLPIEDIRQKFQFSLESLAPK